MDLVARQLPESRRPRQTPAERRSPAGGTLADGGITDRARNIELVRDADGAEPISSVEIVPRQRSEPVCRLMNVAVALVLISLLSPVMLLVALAVRFTSPGPIFYRQIRVGIDRRSTRKHTAFDRRLQDLGGKIFTIYKFRSMYVNAEHSSGAVWAKQADPRCTPVGRFLRKYRFDELPQLFNVLTGDMNIVGPRPERPSIIARLREDIAEYPLRQRAKPGITGWAQINHVYDTSIDDVRLKVRYDLQYLQRQGVSEDLRIMVRTVPVVLFRHTGW
jgi:lipopolysaccharide/colanic/teichoic acid biosynthesis glycosyltransferase